MQGDGVLSPEGLHAAALEAVTFINDETGPSCEAWLTPHGWTLLDSDSNTRADIAYDPDTAQWVARIWFLTPEKPQKVHAIGDLHRLQAEVIAIRPPDVLTPVPTHGIFLDVPGEPLAEYTLETIDRARAQHDAAHLLAIAPHPLTLFHFNSGPPLSLRGECDNIPFSVALLPGVNDEGDYIATTVTAGTAQQTLLYDWPHRRKGERASDSSIATYLLPLLYAAIAEHNHAHPCPSHDGPPPAPGPSVGEAAHRREPHPHIASLARCRACERLLPGNPG